MTVNAHGGSKSIVLHAEDMLCYGGTPLHPDPERLLSLVRRTGEVEGITNIGFSHIALATAYHHPHMVEELSEYLHTLPDVSYIGVQTGIETGSPRLIAMHMRGKPAPAPPDKWPEIVVEALGLLHDQNWVIAGTLVSGLPGETEDDVQASLELMDRIRGLRVLVVPLNFVSMNPARLSDQDSFTADTMTPAHWQLYGACIEHDVRIGRELSNLMVGGNVITRNLGKFALNFIMRGAERYTSALKEGHPPEDFDPRKRSFLIPDL